MVRCEDLALLRFAFIAGELVEEDGHHVFAIPKIGIQVVGYFADIVNKIIDGLLTRNHVDLNI